MFVLVLGCNLDRRRRRRLQDNRLNQLGLRLRLRLRLDINDLWLRLKLRLRFRFRRLWFLLLLLLDLDLESSFDLKLHKIPILSNILAISNSPSLPPGAFILTPIMKSQLAISMKPTILETPLIRKLGRNLTIPR
jgi:hypothetical protein